MMLFLKALIIGFLLAAPVGPIGILCIRRTLAFGFVIGLCTGLGAALADALYGLVVGLGLTSISNILMHYNLLLSIIGGIFLGYLGLKIFFAPPIHVAQVATDHNFFGAFLSSFFLTLMSPVTMLSFTAVFVGTGLAVTPSDYFSAAFFVAGIFFGSMAWWLLLAGGVSFLRSKLNDYWLSFINKVSGIMIIMFALHIIVRALLHGL